MSLGGRPELFRKGGVETESRRRPSSRRRSNPARSVRNGQRRTHGTIEVVKGLTLTQETSQTKGVLAGLPHTTYRLPLLGTPWRVLGYIYIQKPRT